MWLSNKTQIDLFHKVKWQHRLNKTPAHYVFHPAYQTLQESPANAKGTRDSSAAQAHCEQM